ncbi:MFS general substrate transporter [Amylostereum chailletii]|nr:MFS general substrate transporter [Amylostereum chailletii]
MSLSLDDQVRERALTRRVLWKLDIHVLPSLALIWLANFIDRTNVGNARIAGLEKDTHLHDNQFNIALAVFYVPYILVELPSNWALKHVQANRWLPLLIFVWGIVTTLSGLIQNFAGLIAARFFLGMCEGGILPGIVLYLSTLYKPQELQLRVGVFYASGLLATAIIKMDGVANLVGWRWIFILEGLATCLIGLVTVAVLPAGLATASFLTDEERAFALQRFRAATRTTTSAPLLEPSRPITDLGKDGEEIKIKTQDAGPRAEATINQEEEQFEWREVIRGLLEIQAWLTGISYLGIIVSLYSYSLFLPTIVAELGFTGGEAQLRTVPPYIPAVVLTIVVAFLADRYKLRGTLIIILLPITIAGYILAIAATTNEVRYAAVFLIATGLYPTAPCILSILPNNTAGHYKKATCIALQLAVANTGGFVATFVYTNGQAPTYIKGHSIVLGFVCLAWLFMVANVLYCRSENKARSAGRRQSNVESYQSLWDAGETHAPIGDRHPDFSFIL